MSLPKFEILKSRELKNGTVILTVRYNKGFEDKLRIIYGVKRCTKTLVKKFVIECIEKYAREVLDKR